MSSSATREGIRPSQREADYPHIGSASPAASRKTPRRGAGFQRQVGLRDAGHNARLLEYPSFTLRERIPNVKSLYAGDERQPKKTSTPTRSCFIDVRSWGPDAGFASLARCPTCSLRLKIRLGILRTTSMISPQNGGSRRHPSAFDGADDVLPTRPAPRTVHSSSGGRHGRGDEPRP